MSEITLGDLNKYHLKKMIIRNKSNVFHEDQSEKSVVLFMTSLENKPNITVNISICRNASGGLACTSSAYSCVSTEPLNKETKEAVEFEAECLGIVLIPALREDIKCGLQFT